MIRSSNDFKIIVTTKLTTVPIVITDVFIMSVDEIFIIKTVSIPPAIASLETVWSHLVTYPFVFGFVWRNWRTSLQLPPLKIAHQKLDYTHYNPVELPL